MSTVSASPAPGLERWQPVLAGVLGALGVLGLGLLVVLGLYCRRGKRLDQTRAGEGGELAHVEARGGGDDWQEETEAEGSQAAGLHWTSTRRRADTSVEGSGSGGSPPGVDMDVAGPPVAASPLPSLVLHVMSLGLHEAGAGSPSPQPRDMVLATSCMVTPAAPGSALETDTVPPAARTESQITTDYIAKNASLKQRVLQRKLALLAEVEPGLVTSPSRATLAWDSSHEPLETRRSALQLVRTPGPRPSAPPLSPPSPARSTCSNAASLAWDYSGEEELPATPGPAALCYSTLPPPSATHPAAVCYTTL